MTRAHCEICGIIIAPGFVETRPITAPDGKGVVCWSCYQYLERCSARGRPMVEVLRQSRLDLRAERYQR
jgi:hypothetical protein